MFKPFIVLLGIFIVIAAPAMAQGTSQETQQETASTPVRRVYDITHNGDKIGTDVVEIDTDGDTTTVKLTTRILVKVMFVEAYHFEHDAVETWTGGHFVSYKSRTNDNGKKFSISAEVAGKKLDLTANGVKSVLPQIVYPATLWNNDFVGATELIDSDKGTLLSVTVQDLGDETIELNGADVTAHHYKITGDWKRDVWLQNGVPVRIKLRGSDNSTILSDLQP